jgi:transposase
MGETWAQLRVLVVEDDPLVRRVFVRDLAKVADITAAASVAEVRALLLAPRPRSSARRWGSHVRRSTGTSRRHRRPPRRRRKRRRRSVHRDEAGRQGSATDVAAEEEPAEVGPGLTFSFHCYSRAASSFSDPPKSTNFGG